MKSWTRDLHFSVDLSIYLSIYLPIYLSIYLSNYLSIWYIYIYFCFSRLSTIYLKYILNLVKTFKLRHSEKKPRKGRLMISWWSRYFDFFFKHFHQNVYSITEENFWKTIAGKNHKTIVIIAVIVITWFPLYKAAKNIY